MNTFVTAVVVSHDANEYFAATASALLDQTRRPDRILVIDTGTNNFAGDAARAAGFDHIKIASDSNLQQSVSAAIEGSNVPGQWLWLLHDDSAPEPTALAEMLTAVELSPSVAIVGPKLVQWDETRLIRQLGLTLTPLGNLISPIAGQFDQGQNDDLDDVLAVSTAAMLIKVSVFEELGGFDPAAPALASDLDLSVRARLAGYRVIVAPKAKVRHAELSMNGKRERRWLGASPKTALRRAAVHLRFAYAPAISLFLFWFLLPLIGVLRAVVQVSRKRPELIWAELSAAFWGFFTVFARLGSRRRRPKGARISDLKDLRASWSQVRSNNRAVRERDESAENLSAFERGDIDALNGGNPGGFFATGGFWWALGLLAASYLWWPRDIALTGGGVLPLSDSWWQIFTRAGASYQQIGLGFFAPSDPFSWVLALLGGLTFWAPSLSISIWLLVLKPLAFIGAWHLAARLTRETWLKVLAGLAYALWPALQLSQNEARLPTLITAVFLPWLILAVLRVANLGGNRMSSAQSWTSVGVAGLLFAIIGASTPNLLPWLLVGLAFVALVRLRRLGYLIWVALPLAALFAPTAFYYVVALAHPMALLGDPGLAQASKTAPFFDHYGLLTAAPLAIFAAVAILRKRVGQAFVIWLFVILALVSAYLVSNLKFPAVGVGQAAIESVNGSPAALLIAVGLGLAMLLVIALDGITAKRAKRTVAAIAVTLLIAPNLSLSLLNAPIEIPGLGEHRAPSLNYSDGRVVPSIVAAEAQQGSSHKLLVLTPSVDSSGKQRLAAELVAGDGVHLDDVSLAYRFSIAKIAKQKYGQIAQLVADLVSANGTNLTQPLQQQQISYVLVPLGASSSLAEIGIALDSVSELEPVGVTDFGRLWRVREPSKSALVAPSSPWSITKGVQLAILIGFGLMAIPTRSNRRRGTEEIFMDAAEDAQ